MRDAGLLVLDTTAAVMGVVPGVGPVAQSTLSTGSLLLGTHLSNANYEDWPGKKISLLKSQVTKLQKCVNGQVKQLEDAIVEVHNQLSSAINHLSTAVRNRFHRDDIFKNAWWGSEVRDMFSMLHGITTVIVNCQDQAVFHEESGGSGSSWISGNCQIDNFKNNGVHYSSMSRALDKLLSVVEKTTATIEFGQNQQYKQFTKGVLQALIQVGVHAWGEFYSMQVATGVYSTIFSGIVELRNKVWKIWNHLNRKRGVVHPATLKWAKRWTNELALTYKENYEGLQYCCYKQHTPKDLIDCSSCRAGGAGPRRGGRTIKMRKNPYTALYQNNPRFRGGNSACLAQQTYGLYPGYPCNGGFNVIDCGISYPSLPRNHCDNRRRWSDTDEDLELEADEEIEIAAYEPEQSSSTNILNYFGAALAGAAFTYVAITKCKQKTQGDHVLLENEL